MTGFRKLVVVTLIIASVSIGIGGMLLSRAGENGSTVWRELRNFFQGTNIGIDLGNHVEVDAFSTHALEGVEEILVDTIVGNIFILEKEEAGGELEVRVKGTLEERFQEDFLKIERRGDVLVIEVLKVRSLSAIGGITNRTRLDITLEVPKHYDEDLTLKTVSGNVLVNGLSLYRVEGVTVSGDVVLENGRMEELILRSTSGSLYVYSDVETFTGTNVSGTLLANRVEERIKYESVSGSITVVLLDAAGETALKSVSGSIQVDYQGQDRIAYALESVSGRLEVKGNGETLTADRRLSRGDSSARAQLKASTVSGSIRVNY